MARDKIGEDMLRVRFPDGTFDRIDAVSGNRSEFVRDAVAGALADMEVPLGTGGSVDSIHAGDAVPYLTGRPKKNSIAPPHPDHVDDDGSVTSFNKPKRSKRADPAVEAVKAAVAGIASKRPPQAVDPIVAPDDPRMTADPGLKSSVVSPRAQDILDLVHLLRSGSYTSRMAERALGWPGLRYANAEKALLASGRVAVDGGVLVVRADE